MRNKLVATAIAVALGTVSLAAQADDTTATSLNDIFSQGHIDGELRLYDFNRSYDGETAAKPSAQALSGAVLLNGTTGSFYGFSAAASLASASALGSLGDNPKRVDTTLMGANDSLSAMTQAYLQYKNEWVMVRGGYQELTTPWMGNSDGRALPSSYDAISAIFTPVKGWNIIALRSFGWRSRVSSSYHNDNLYYPSTYRGDTLYGGNNALPSTAQSANGTYALGTNYAGGGLKAEAWYYDFKDFAHLGYANGSYVFKTGTGFDPVIGAQYVTETGGSNNILVETNTKINGYAGDSVKSRAWGADLGVVIPNGRFDVFYNKLQQENGAVGNGSIISPYTASYATDPLYTTSMIRGLVETGPGHAMKGKFSYDLFDKKLQLVVAYAKYTTSYYGDSHNTYFDIIYNLDGFLKGMSLRDRWERSSGGTNGLNPGDKDFTYNRVMVTYKF